MFLQIALSKRTIPVTGKLQEGESRTALLQVRTEGSDLPETVSIQMTVMSVRRLATQSFVRLPVGQSVTVECDDIMFLGEMIVCTQSVADTWHGEIAIEQVLTSLQSLVNLRTRLLEGMGVNVDPQGYPCGPALQSGNSRR